MANETWKFVQAKSKQAIVVPGTLRPAPGNTAPRQAPQTSIPLLK